MSEIIEHYGYNSFPSRELSSGMRLSQYFVARRNILKRVGISFGTRGNSTSFIFLTVTTAEGLLMVERKLDATNFVDNSFAVIDLDLSVRPGGMYVINMTGYGRPGDGAWVKWGQSRHSNTERLYMLDCNTNNNEMYCFMVYEDEVKKEVIVPPVRIVPDNSVAPEIKADDIIPTEVSKPAPPVVEKTIVVDEDVVEVQEETPSKIADVNTVKGKVSVVVWHKNAADKIEETLNSIYAQTYKHVGVTVVDDGSLTKDREAMSLLIRKYDNQYKIKKIILKSSKGPGKARNLGADESDGEFLLFCDAGTILGPDYFFEALNTFHEHPDVGWVYSDHKKGEAVVTSRKYDPATLSEGYCHMTSMMRRNLFPGFDGKKKNMTADLFHQMAKKGAKGDYVNLPLFTVGRK